MKKLLSSLLVVALLAGCSSNNNSPASDPAELETIIVGASPSPHAQILESVKETLKAEGYDLVIKEFDDYIIPNTALENDELDANYFQHQPYLDGFNNDYGTHLASVLKVHFEPLGVYAGGSSEIKDTLTLDDIKDGAQIAVPNDGTNEARALQLLEAHGLIKIKAGVGLAATVLDIEENPKNIKIVEIEAKNLSAILPDVDYAVINGNYALSADIVDKLCVSEDKNSEGAQEYANVLVVKEGHENDEKIEALKKALTSADTKTFIENTFGTLVIPVFD
ncbi:MetQ/NlpA family ABC transporter substrate-binding protein [Dielma fastidiosa]|uniref:MetQ/NlpA family ABC transporter substrate-binding protein n=1 Tax=Dielma fastidiosa TaxID=1034346 RepID=UPI00356952CC